MMTPPTKRSFELGKILPVFIVACLLVGCDYIPSAENTAKKAVRESLYDPDSAKFTDVFKGATDGSYCGLINAKNRFGAYTGSTLFIYESFGDGVGFASLVPEPLKERDFKQLVAPGTFDKERFIEQYTKIRNGCKAATDWERVCGSKLPRETPKLCEGLDTQTYTQQLYKRFYSESE